MQLTSSEIEVRAERPFSRILGVILVAVLIATALVTITPSIGFSATSDDVDREALAELQMVLKESGYQGDLSEGALRQAY